MRKKTVLDTYDKVKEKALRLLEFRSHSEYELRQKLHIAGASDEHIEQALEFCRHYGFVNDKSYALGKARDLINLKKYGLRRVKSELKMKGLLLDEEHFLDANDSATSSAAKKRWAMPFPMSAKKSLSQPKPPQKLRRNSGKTLKIPLAF